MKTKEIKSALKSERRMLFGYSWKVFLSVLLLVPSGSIAQTWTWPMAGHKAGENIICAPNSHIEKEYNCCDLFIGGNEGDIVVSPVDGVIKTVSILYWQRFGLQEAINHDNSQTWKENIARIHLQANYDAHFLSGNITIVIADGRNISIAGLNGDYKFKVGQTVKAGDTLGTLAYSYKGIPKPSLVIAVSLPNHVADDPLSPFGVASRFHLDIEERDDPMPADKMREDLTVLEKAVLELYPSLNERMSDKAFHDSMEVLRQSVTQPTHMALVDPLLRFTHLLHDSHVALLPDRLKKKMFDAYGPVFFYTWCDDTMRVLMAGKGFEKYRGRIVKSIDGMEARDYARQTHQYQNLYDLNVQSMLEEDNVMLSFRYPLLNKDATATSKSHVVFDDGEEVDIPFRRIPVEFHSEGTPSYRIRDWYYINVMNDEMDSSYVTRQLDDSTAYLSIRTFTILDEDLEHLKQWIGACKAPNMIIDLRNNSGGDSDKMNKILACFAQQPLNRQRGSHLYVKKKSGFETLEYSENHTNNDTLFTEYIQVDGKQGYYCFDQDKTCSCIMPDSSHQYTGRVYVLTNGKSLSCATVFPAVLVRNRRGVSVGRETGSAYHFINAFELAQIILPNTRRTVSIPMVKVVFDTTVCERTPWGRGLLPDYELPLTYNEVIMGADGETDVMLEYALQLIADGKYLSDEDPFAEIDAPRKASHWWIWLLGAVGVIAIIATGTLRACVLHRRNFGAVSARNR